ncbi:zinc-binding alcohol dehydrogenase family protein [Microvirga rosea]|uniref:zinc-binding alcohol dehydrogenase family protein n=1 Tax=Microvirga rosea TaxID=2715425 RepID=UPI001D0A6821|nr:zinc-binding alcohol dehydrogenase family protein [Microvirga rosea]MCB8822204.1 zinc-binding alcohol dehydrogenase family protein [Microvirga rosea]
MLTITCDTPGTLSAGERPRPIRKNDEVLVRIRRVGVCGTDLHIFSGKQPYLSYPRVMGHELSGTVEEAPSGSRLTPGETVCIMPYISCGECHACRQGKSNCCQKIQVLGVHRDGGMAEYVSIPERFVHPAEGLSLDQAAMVEFLAIGAHAVRRSHARENQRVLVVGAGPIGIAVALFAKLRDAQVTVIDSRQDRLAFCADHLSVQHTVIADPGDEERLSALTAGDFFDIVFDATGNPAAMERGFRLVAHGGTYVLVSIVGSDITFSDPEFHKREMTLMGSRNATPEDFETVIAAIRSRKVPTEAMNTHRMALAEVPERFSDLLDPSAGVIKALVDV